MLLSGCFKVLPYIHLQDDIHVHVQNKVNAKQHILNPFKCLRRKFVYTCKFLLNMLYYIMEPLAITRSYSIWKPLLLCLLNFSLSIASFLLTQWVRHCSLQARSPSESVLMYHSSVVGSHAQHQVRVLSQSPGEPQAQVVAGAQFLVPGEFIVSWLELPCMISKTDLAFYK